MKTGAVSEGFRKPFLKPYIGTRHRRRRGRRGKARRCASSRSWARSTRAAPKTSPSHRRVFVCHPAKAAEEAGCAKTILSTLARRAYRRPVTDADLKVLLDFYNQGRADGDFDAGIELALQRILVSPSFLFRTEFAPTGRARPTLGAYRISDIELASRLSFFLWSSIPDDELLDLAIAGQAARAGRPGAPDPADARRSALAGVHHQLRGPVAVAAPAAGHRAGSVSVSRLRRHAGAGVPAGSRALLRQHRARGSAGASIC